MVPLCAEMDHGWGAVVQTLVRALVIVELEVVVQPVFQGRHSRILLHIDVLVFDRAPQAFNKDIVKRPPTPIHITSMAIPTIISLAGNIQLALPGHEHSPFAWLEALASPIIVLATAYVIKQQILEAIEVRHANDQVFQTALDDWRLVTAMPEDYPSWMQFYANALQDALRKTNARRKETLSQMTVEDWHLAVGREMRADMWYRDTEPESDVVLPFSPAVDAIPASNNGNGNHPKVSVSAV